MTTANAQSKTDGQRKTVTIPVRTKTPGNNGFGHWAPKAKEAKIQRDAAYLSVITLNPLPPFPVRVRLVRISPRGRRMDPHNLFGALKHVIDGIADAYGVDDGKPGWKWEADQERGKTYGVRVEIESIGGAL